MKYPIFLIGFMASGKTSKGKKLARKLEFDFIDLDEEIERKEGQSIATIFEVKGEAYFRQQEADVLRRIPETTKAVIALGGGTPCFHENMKYVNERGTSIYIKRAATTILGRLRQNKAKRPLVADLTDEELKAFISENLEKREAFYKKATLTFDADARKWTDLLEELAS